MYYGAVDAQQAQRQACAMREQATALQAGAEGNTRQALTDFAQKAEGVAGNCNLNAGSRGQRGGGGQRGGARGGGAAPSDSLSAAATALAGVMNSLQAADVEPTAVQLAAIDKARADQTKAIARWTELKTVDLVALNAKLKTAGLEAIISK
jgi:hypothetical protein